MTAPKWWDVTIRKSDIPKEVLIECLKDNKGEKFVIGEEIGNGGYEHWQVRVQFKKPMTINELLNLNTKWGITGHWSPTHVKDFNYCEKEGNFYRSWEGALAKYHDLELREWQHLAVGALGDQGDREIAVIVDTEGGQGKTTMSKFCEVNHIADVCPVCSGEAGEYVAYCLGYQAKGYIFDIPRCDTIKDKKQLWKAIEQIKNGCLYDGRYAPRKVWIDPPKILVMTNDYPPVAHLSQDRWKIYDLVDGELLGPWNRDAIKDLATLQLAQEQEQRRKTA